MPWKSRFSPTILALSIKGLPGSGMALKFPRDDEVIFGFWPHRLPAGHWPCFTFQKRFLVKTTVA